MTVAAEAATRPERLIDVAAAARRVDDGMTVGISGFAHQNAPMTVVRELIRRGVRDLTLVAGPTAGMETDILIGAGCVRRLVTAGVALEGVVGIAPAFRYYAQRGDLDIWECDECIWYVALKAGAWGVPYLLWPGGVGTSLPELNPDLVEVEHEGRRYLRVPAVQPDIVLLHAPEGDCFGNVRSARRAYLGRTFAERALVEACAGPLIATVEQLVDNDRVLEAPERTMVFGAEIAVAPGGAHPGGVSGHYAPDLAAIRAYADAGAELLRGDAASYARFVENWVSAAPAAESDGPSPRSAASEPVVADVRRIEGTDRGSGEHSAGTATATIDDSAAPASSVDDLMICVVARHLRDEQIVAFGLHAELMLTAALLAQATHAPRLRIRHGLRHERGLVRGTAAWTDRADDDSWRRVEYLESHDAILRVANPASPMCFCNVFFVGGMQIDRQGNTNLIGTRGADTRPAVRGPGSIGTTSIGSLAEDLVLFSREHTARRFVESVDFVSVPGWGRRAAHGLEGGPSLVVTGKAVMDFQKGAMRLRSVHPGITVDEVIESTGFELVVADTVPTTPSPTPAEREALERLRR